MHSKRAVSTSASNIYQSSRASTHRNINSIPTSVYSSTTISISQYASTTSLSDSSSPAPTTPSNELSAIPTTSSTQSLSAPHTSQSGAILAAQDPTGKSSLSPGEIAGISTGAILGVILVIAIAIFCSLRYRRRHQYLGVRRSSKSEYEPSEAGYSVTIAQAKAVHVTNGIYEGTRGDLASKKVPVRELVLESPMEREFKVGVHSQRSSRYYSDENNEFRKGIEGMRMGGNK
ncbi:hypothetical protein BCR34DRAFT_239224 [Clohesyomyces aquaticus]|uniref:Uncharacterized protein n=1 Tax=Clohesyomyces aquaticus TaxID=1231657 RepID=A0A1Y1ZVQ2_9PLEO|nr:hypothetical protein BCR34DRAFT_239224 [Clohesyomyces aquaticus]